MWAVRLTAEYFFRSLAARPAVMRPARMKVNIYRTRNIRSWFFFTALFLAAAQEAWGQSEHTANLIKGAQNEGKLVWYTSLGVSDSRQLLDAFEKQYPFVKTELFRASGEKTMNRIMTETQAGRWEFDVVSLSAINILVRRKLISSYVSPEAHAVPAVFRDAEGHWTGTHSNYLVIGYNTSMVPAGEAPKDWPDLLNLKWKGRLAIDQEEYPWYATLSAAWGKEKTQRYMQALARQQIQWRRGHTLMAQLMAAGEFPLAIVYADNAEALRRKGAPLDWVNTVDPVVASVHSMEIGRASCRERV